MPSPSTVVAAAVLVLTGLPTTLRAQTCIGSASFAAGPVRVGAGADFTDGAKGYGVQMAVGSPTGPFATAGLSAVDYDDIDEGGTILSVVGGYAVDLGATKRAQFCPMVGFDRQSGPNIDTGFGVADISSRSFSFGGSVGGTVSSTPAMDFVPFVGAAFVTQKATVEFNGASESASEEYSIITIGAGFVLNKHLTIRPALTFPVGLEDSDPSYGIAFAFNFGGSASATGRGR